jgi:N-acetylmuramoyl-L-alanine amidase
MNKMVIVTLMVFAVFAILLSVAGQAKTYQVTRDPDFLSGRISVWNVLIDPGHGGPANGGGQRYNENGDYGGT